MTNPKNVWILLKVEITLMHFLIILIQKQTIKNSIPAENSFILCRLSLKNEKRRRRNTIFEYSIYNFENFFKNLSSYKKLSLEVACALVPFSRNMD